MAKKATSPKAARASSKVLRDKSQDKASKTAAGSDLSKREKEKKKIIFWPSGFSSTRQIPILIITTEA